MLVAGAAVPRGLTAGACGVPPGRVRPEMPILQRVKSFLQSPQGRRLTDQGRRVASDPRNRERAKGFLSRLRRR